jgi:hypothetical protein
LGICCWFGFGVSATGFWWPLFVGCFLVTDKRRSSWLGGVRQRVLVEGAWWRYAIHTLPLPYKRYDATRTCELDSYLSVGSIMLEVIREGQGKVSTFLARGDQVGNGEERTLFVVLRTTKTTLPVLSPHALRACGDTGGYDRCGTLRYLGVVIRTNLPEYGGGFSTEGRMTFDIKPVLR